MCGIGGILRTDGGEIPESWLDAIDDRIAHRGPDGHGRFRDRVEIDDGAGPRTVEVALVHRRMSIIDLADGGQPMVSERGPDGAEGLVAVVFNGCIYNHRALRAELESLGHRFVTDHSDTEVLVHGHRAWGDELPDRLEGMYAYAIWDRAAGELILARDPFGEKPLYVRASRSEDAGSGRTVVFSSARGAVEDRARELFAPPDDLRASTGRYLRLGYGWSNRLGDDDGHTSAVAPNGRRRLGVGPDASRRGTIERHGGDHPPRAEDIEPLLDQAVTRRLEADVPLGCFLSGGVDSSLVAFFAHRRLGALDTFCVRMPDARYDESPYAERVAAHLGTSHRTLDVAVRPAEDLVELVRHLGQPFADSSILPTYWVSRAAREHVEVALSGDGGDELFVGYERYRAADVLARHWRWLRWLGPLMPPNVHPKSVLAKMRRLTEMAQDYPHLGIIAMESIFTRFGISELLGPIEESAAVKTRDPVQSAQERLRRLDLEGYLPGDLMLKVDTASMAVALEVRCPMLDRDLAAAALALPIQALTPGGRRKGLLRAIARRHLPAEVVDRPKMGFAIPVGRWFRSDFGGMKTLLLDHLEAAEPFGPLEIDRLAVDRLVREHMAAHRDHGHRLFALLTLSMWARGS